MSCFNQILVAGKRLACYCILALIAVCPLTAQEVIFNRVLPPRGSIFGLINGITQDPNGYMWFAAYWKGIHRFDGYQVVTYSHDPQNPNSLSSNDVEEVYADRKGIIWVGSEKTGLDRFDPGTGTFTNYRHHLNDASSLSDDHVTAMLEDRNGVLWVGTKNGLNCLDQKSGTFTHYHNQAGDKNSLSDNRVQVIYEDRQGTIWVGTGPQHLGNDEVDENGGLNRFDRSKGNFTRYKHHPEDPHSLVNNRVGAIFEDSRGNFWVATAGGGLHTMDREKGSFQRHIYDPTHPGKLSQPGPEKDLSQDLSLFFIREDGSGAIWFGSSGGWITKYDPSTCKAIHYNSFNGDVQSMKTVSGAYTSREGVLWVTTWVGNIYRVDPFQNTIPHYNTGFIVHNLHEDVSGILWLSTFGAGLRRINKNHGIIKSISKDVLRMYSLPNTEVESIYEQNDSIIWFGSKDLYRFNRKTKRFRIYSHDPQDENSLSEGDIRTIIKDQPGSLWIGTKTGLDHLDIETGVFKHWRNIPGDGIHPNHHSISSLLMDHTGNLWIGTFESVDLFNREKGTFRHFNLAGEVGTIIEDFEHIIWVGTSSGLYRSNAAADSFYRFTDARIPMTSITVVPGLVEDDQHNLWASSTIGIFRLSPDRSQVSLFSRNQGVDPSAFNFPAMKASKERSGELFFACNTGYYAFFPGQIKTNQHSPQIVINDFWLADKPVEPGNDAPLKQSITQAKEIKLNHSQNTFSFDFDVIHYSSPEDNRLFFKLENLDNTWKEAGSVKRAWYYNIRPGHYIFRVKGVSNDGIWAEKSVAVIVTPPWWSNWWIRISAVLVTAMLFYTLIRWRLNLKYRLQLERSEKDRQLANLRHKTAELEMQALRAQMNPHFIFNSLNSINSFILHNHKNLASRYLTKFSRLVRLILHNSQATLITLKSELETLQLYLELEVLRFDRHFDYKVIVAEDIDISEINVPPLIFQPFVENAIWHGLMHKEENGHLELNISRDAEVLCCIITDDGIGRKKAAELKSKSASAHKSMGMQITADRIEMLQHTMDLKEQIKVTDLILADGSPGGTQVTLKMPVIYA